MGFMNQRLLFPLCWESASTVLLSGEDVCLYLGNCNFFFWVKSFLLPYPAEIVLLFVSILFILVSK